MTLVFDRRAELGNVPGTHALICGVSEYPHLPGGAGEQTGYDFGLQQLSSPSRTASALHTWLTEHADDLAAPLATSRLLLAPSAAERGPDYRFSHVDLPTLENFLREAAAWRQDASPHPEGMTILYVSGQGFILSRSNQPLLLHDYGEPVGSILRNSVDIASVFQGMAPTSFAPDIARTQLYFVDTGQFYQSLPPELLASHPTQVFDLPLTSDEDRVAVTFSPAPGEVSFGKVGGLSLFGEVLLEALGGAAAEKLETEDWVVSTLGLVSYLGPALRARSEELGVRQDVAAGGLVGRAIVVRNVPKPQVELTIQMAEEARAGAKVIVRDSELKPVREDVTMEPGEVTVLSVPAGLYLLEVRRAEGEAQTLPIAVYPPSSRITVGATKQ